MRKKLLPFNLQYFAEPASDTSGANTDTGTGDGAGNGTQTNTGTGNIDYDKIQQMLDTATTKKENAVLKSYFQQQGLSEDEAKLAMDQFKASRQQTQQQQQADNSQLQTQVSEAQKAAEQAQIELEATKVAMTLGIDAKTLPYVLKMADLSNVKDKDGKISADNVKTALSTVLEAVPALKGQKEESKGFQIGGSGQSGQQNSSVQNVTQKRWNRFNN